MNYRKTTDNGSRQQGFFTIGVGLTLLVIYGTIGTGILSTHQPTLDDGEQLAAQQTSAYSGE